MYGALSSTILVAGALDYAKLNKRGGGQPELRKEVRVWITSVTSPCGELPDVGVTRAVQGYLRV